MLIFDELKKNDPQLRVVAAILAAGLFILFAGLWWVQIVSAREYQSHLETQAYRTVRIPAERGKILDRNGIVLAGNRPSYNLSLYLDDLHDRFHAEYQRLRPKKIVTNSPPFWKFWDRSRSIIKKFAPLTREHIDQLIWQSRYDVANSVVQQISRELGEPITLSPKDFEQAYIQRRAMPLTVVSDANAVQVARFEERNPGTNGAALSVQPVRVYPFGTLAAHLLGYVRSDDRSIAGEDAFFNYRLPDYRGVIGIEGGFDPQLHGHAGGASVLVNNLGYRQSETVWQQPEPGKNITLTIDFDLQRAAQESLAAHQGTNALGAVVVMNVRTGDVLTMVSSPAYDPNEFAQGISAAEYQQIQELTAERNRATQENYAPGSIFKPVVALAALEHGLDPNATYKVEPDPTGPWHGCIYVGRRKIKDTVPPGLYDLQRALEQSSNAYFIHTGLQTGIENVIRLAEKFHFGESEDLPTRQETKGYLPTLAEVRSPGWHDGDSANIFFGQGEIAVTPLQMAVAYSAIANGGKVLWPRLVEKITPQDPSSGEATTIFPSGVVRDNIGVSARNLKIVREAMLTETEGTAGTGRRARVEGLQICGKTGTAQVENTHGRVIKHNYWFASFAPYENPKYTVVVMVQSENPGSGGSVCAPIAHDIYKEILEKEQTAPQTLAKAN